MSKQIVASGVSSLRLPTDGTRRHLRLRSVVKEGLASVIGRSVEVKLGPWDLLFIVSELTTDRRWVRRLRRLVDAAEQMHAEFDNPDTAPVRRTLLASHLAQYVREAVQLSPEEMMDSDDA